MHLATRLIVAVLVSALLYACDSGSSPSDTNNDPNAPVAIGTDTLDLVLTEREAVIHFSKDSIVAWKRTDKCTEGKIVPDSLRTTYTLTAGEDDNAMLTQTNCHQVNINCDWQLSVAMDGITAGTWNATTFTRSAHYGNTWSKTAYIDESDSTVALTLSSTEVKTVITRHYCYSDNWTDPDDQWDVTVATQGCASATFTLDDGTQATTRLESATADGSQLSYSITYQGTTCTHTRPVFPAVATASQCSTAWKIFTASEADHFYWDDWMVPKYNIFDQCMRDANFPDDLINAMNQIE